MTLRVTPASLDSIKRFYQQRLGLSLRREREILTHTHRLSGESGADASAEGDASGASDHHMGALGVRTKSSSTTNGLNEVETEVASFVVPQAAYEVVGRSNSADGAMWYTDKHVIGVGDGTR